MCSSLFWAKFPSRAEGDINSFNKHLLHTPDASCSGSLGSGSRGLRGEQAPPSVLWGSHPGDSATSPSLDLSARWVNEIPCLSRALYSGKGDG